MRGNVIRGLRYQQHVARERLEIEPQPVESQSQRQYFAVKRISGSRAFGIDLVVLRGRRNAQTEYERIVFGREIDFRKQFVEYSEVRHVKHTEHGIDRRFGKVQRETVSSYIRKESAEVNADRGRRIGTVGVGGSARGV